MGVDYFPEEAKNAWQRPCRWQSPAHEKEAQGPNTLRGFRSVGFCLTYETRRVSAGRSLGTVPLCGSPVSGDVAPPFSWSGLSFRMLQLSTPNS